MEAYGSPTHPCIVKTTRATLICHCPSCVVSAVSNCARQSFTLLLASTRVRGERGAGERRTAPAREPTGRDSDLRANSAYGYASRDGDSRARSSALICASPAAATPTAARARACIDIILIFNPYTSEVSSVYQVTGHIFHLRDSYHLPHELSVVFTVACSSAVTSWIQKHTGTAVGQVHQSADRPRRGAFKETTRYVRGAAPPPAAGTTGTPRPWRSQNVQSTTK